MFENIEPLGLIHLGSVDLNGRFDNLLLGRAETPGK
jgi:hypothetical protein